jgi:RNA polymerase-interacting CarD/CdnL/TRCF family regulator
MNVRNLKVRNFSNLEQIAEISRFLVAIYAKNANLSDDEKAILRQAYRALT